MTTVQKFDDQQILSNVMTIISKHAQNRSALKNVSLETNILRDLQVNSAKFVDIVLDMEDAFSFQINDDDADKISTVGDAVHLVKKMLH